MFLIKIFFFVESPVVKSYKYLLYLSSYHALFLRYESFNLFFLLLPIEEKKYYLGLTLKFEYLKIQRNRNETCE